MHALESFIEDLTLHTLNLDKKRLFHKQFSLNHLSVDAYFSDKAYAELCEANLFEIQKELDQIHHVTLYLLDAESLSWPRPPRWFQSTYNRHNAQDAFQALNLWGAYLDEPRAWQYFNPITKVGIQLIKNPSSMIPWESGGPLRHFLHWAYQSMGKMLCHSGSLGINNQGVLLIGPGGSGKSGTTLAGISHGLYTVGDDYCLIDPVGAMAYPLYQIIKQDPKGFERLSLKVADINSLQVNWQKKYEVHRRLFKSDPFAGALKIKALMLLKIKDVKVSSLKTSTPGEAMKAWALSSSFQLPDHEKESIAFISDLCKRLPVMEITLSHDDKNIAEIIYDALTP
jgi:hypothetical protein